jgi:hypothetical protein
MAKKTKTKRNLHQAEQDDQLCLQLAAGICFQADMDPAEFRFWFPFLAAVAQCLLADTPDRLRRWVRRMPADERRFVLNRLEAMHGLDQAVARKVLRMTLIQLRLNSPFSRRIRDAIRMRREKGAQEGSN